MLPHVVEKMLFARECLGAEVTTMRCFSSVPNKGIYFILSKMPPLLNYFKWFLAKFVATAFTTVCD